MLTRWEIDRRVDAQVLKAVTPQHSAAEAAVGACDGEDANEAERLRERVQHLADPLAEPAEVPEVVHAELGKRYDQAYEPPYGYPVPAAVHPEMFRRSPITTGEAAYSAGYEPPRPMSSLTPDATLTARPLMQDGQLEVPMSVIRRPDGC
jgi:hypothetical protein